MPYISPYDRALVHNAHAVTAGELNYIISYEINAYLLEKGISYDNIQHVLKVLNTMDFDPRGVDGLEAKIANRVNDSKMSTQDSFTVLRAVELEFYDRVAKPYEKEKRLTNGEVYTVLNQGMEPL